MSRIRIASCLSVVVLLALPERGAAIERPLGYGGSFQSPAAIDPVPQFQRGLEEVPARLRRQLVSFSAGVAPGTIVIDTANTYLYYVLGGGQAIRYGIGVGRDGFTWSGVQTVSSKTEWPDWIPPAEMLRRQPYLPRIVGGGPGNPLGARALYLGATAYRIHGTNAPETIGHRVSSGCIRMLNQDVIDLYERSKVGATVIVLSGTRDATRDVTRREPVATLGGNHISAFGVH